MRRSIATAIAAIAISIALTSPAEAQQAPGPLSALVGAGAPLVASGAPTDHSAPGRTVSRDADTRPGTGTEPSPSVGTAVIAASSPALTPPAQPILGLSLDPRSWAGDLVDAMVTTLARAIVDAIRGFTDWAVGFGGSSMNFVTRTPAEGSYESLTVRSLWELSRAMANALLALLVMWGGFNVIVKQHLRSPYDGAMELLPRIALAALAANLTLEFARLLIDTNNALSAAVGASALPGYEQAGSLTTGMADVLVAVAYAIVALLLVFQMLMRLALIDVLIVLAPVMVLMWVLPQTQGWTRWWAHLLPLTVFQQAVQMLVLRLGSALMVELTPGSASGGMLTLLLGIAVCWLTLKVPSLLRGQVQHAGLGSVVSLVMVSRAAGALRGAAAAAR